MEVPPWKFRLAEGGSDQAPSPAKDAFFTDAINTAATIDGVNPVALIAVWDSDGYANHGTCGSCVVPSQNKFALFGFAYTPLACPVSPFPGPSVGWHYELRRGETCPSSGVVCCPIGGMGCTGGVADSTCWCLTHDDSRTYYGTFNLSGLRSIGVATANAFAAH